MRSSSVTRRKLLKRAGVGAAALGAGSLVTAGTASALAFCHDCACDHCPVANGCGTHHGGNTACFPTTEGCCFCGESTICEALEPCETSGDCPPGWGCILSCCSAVFGFGPLCIGPPGTVYSVGANAAGPQAAQAAGAAQPAGTGDTATMVHNPFLGNK
jgi:hypothetical protein